MAHSEIYPDGSKITRFVSGANEAELGEKLGVLSKNAFGLGAEKVEQHRIHGNEPCPMCPSGIRFDLCCGNKEEGREILGCSAGPLI